MSRTESYVYKMRPINSREAVQLTEILQPGKGSFSVYAEYLGNRVRWDNCVVSGVPSQFLEPGQWFPDNVTCVFDSDAYTPLSDEEWSLVLAEMDCLPEPPASYFDLPVRPQQPEEKAENIDLNDLETL